MNWDYISGFFDADGSITAITNNKGCNKTIQMSFHNTELDIINSIRAFIKTELGFNGSVSKKKAKKENHKISYELKYCYKQGWQVANKMTLVHPRKKHRVSIYNKIQALTRRSGKYTESEIQERETLIKTFFEFGE